jgi:hypothetical protein
MKLKLLLSLMAVVLTGCASAGSQSPTATPAVPTAAPAVASSTQAAPDLAPFFSTIPISTTLSIAVANGETAHISLANMGGDIDVANWIGAGWTVGRTLGPDENVPDDCVLHPRASVTHQLYASCGAGAVFAVVPQGADFVYVIVINEGRAVARTVQAGRRYNSDTTGLIPSVP